MTSTFTIRPALRSDMDSLGAVAEDAGLFPRELLPDMISGYLDATRPDIWLVAAEGPSVAGFGFCQPERMTDGTWNLLAIGVLERSRGLGAGATLLRELETRLRAGGGRLLLVETLGTPDFARTRDFYLANGFVEEARIRDFYEPGGDKVVFWKQL